MWTKYSLIKSTLNLQRLPVFPLKIERLPRGGRLQGSALPSKSNLFSPLDKGVFINTGGGGWANRWVFFFFRFQKKGDQRKIKPVWGVIRNFKMEKRVILGAKTKKIALLTILCNNNCLIFNSRQNIINDQTCRNVIVIKAKYGWNLYLFLQNFTEF